jgi:hypothetical protein
VEKLSSVLLLATLSLLAEHVPVSAQQLAVPNETAQAGALLPPRVERVPTPATRLYMGMPKADVERTMGAAAEVATPESAGVMVRVLKYRLSPIPAKITISDGRVSGVALDIAADDDRELPTFSRSVWPGIHRMAALRMLGAPAEDRLRESLGMKLEHMIFARGTGRFHGRLDRRSRADEEGRRSTAVGYFRSFVTSRNRCARPGDRATSKHANPPWHEHG